MYADRLASLLPKSTVEPWFYDVLAPPFDSVRREVVDLLNPSPGQVVLDIGCGTGLCLPLLIDKVGSTGRVVAIDRSARMLQLALRRVRTGGWGNVDLIEAAVEDLKLDVPADAALFCAAHDILQSEAALEAVFHNVRPGARVAAVGPKAGPAWLVGLNLAVAFWTAPLVETFEGWEKPWARLGRYVQNLKVVEVALGTGYFVSGTARPGGA